MAALRPGLGLSNGRGGIKGRSHRTHSRLTVDENAMTLFKFCFNEGYA